MTVKNVKLVFDRRHRATDTTPAPVEFSVNMGDGRRRIIPTGVRLCAGQWDADASLVRFHSDARALNRRLIEALQAANAQIVAQITMYGYLTDDAVDRIFGIDRREREKPASFIEWARDQSGLTNARGTTKERREVVLRAVEAFGRIRTFDDLTPARVKAFDDYLRRTGHRCDYTLKSNYHKVLHYFCRLAISAELIERDPYAVFRPKAGRPRERRPLTAAELDRLRAAVLPDRLARVRDLFIFCAYTGLAYADSQCVEFFEVVDISGARFIDATRRKTGTRFLTPLLAPAAAVLSRYGGRLPHITNQRANVYLHEIERRLNLCKPLTTHVARHTFATTVALAHGVPVESLSRMLGHRDIKTTQIYAKVLAQTVADDGAALAAKIR